MSEFNKEARAILRYLLGKEPSRNLLERYIKAATTFDGGNAIGLHRFTLLWPALLRFFDMPFSTRGPRQTTLRKRLNIGLTLCETSSEGTYRLRQRNGESRAGILMAFFASLAADALTMPVRLLIWRLW